jgi:predicted component of type VI protein secretion system
LHEQRDFHACVLTQQETLSCLVLQDLWESNVGMVVRELRQLLEDHPAAAYLEVKLDSSPEALAQIRNLLTPEENARIKFLGGRAAL